MGDWRAQGHAIRRRTGAPSSHLEAAGPPRPGSPAWVSAHAELRAAGHKAVVWQSLKDSLNPPQSAPPTKSYDIHADGSSTLRWE